MTNRAIEAAINKPKTNPGMKVTIPNPRRPQTNTVNPKINQKTKTRESLEDCIALTYSLTYLT